MDTQWKHLQSNSYKFTSICVIGENERDIKLNVWDYYYINVCTGLKQILFMTTALTI